MSNVKPEVPTDAYELLKVLKEEYPARCMRPGDDPGAHMFYSGHVALVEEIEQLLYPDEEDEDE